MASTAQENNLNQKSRQAFYFNHIPKTAGTSFIVIFDRFFDVSDIFKPQLWWEIGELESVRAKPYLCFRGHFGKGGQVLSQWPMQQLTILRDPVALSHSTYQYVKREKQARLHSYVVDNGLSFEDFLTDSKTCNLASNRLLMSLSFGLDLDQESCPTDLVVNDQNYRKFRKRWNQSRKTLADNEHLAMVKDDLSEFFWVGLQEQLDQALLLLCYQMAWSPVGPTTRLNQHAQQHQISARATDLVNQLNPIDSQLYAWAKQRFEARWQQFCEAANLDPNDLSGIESYVDQYYQRQHLKQHETELNHGVKYRFNQPLLGQNWHRRESIDQSQETFRWTGPTRTTQIDFWLKPQAYVVAISYLNVAGAELLDDLEIAVNGHPVDWTHQPKGAGGVIQFNTEIGMTREHGLFRLTMVTEELRTHAAVFASTDNRKVGLAIQQIEVVAP